MIINLNNVDGRVRGSGSKLSDFFQNQIYCKVFSLKYCARYDKETCGELGTCKVEHRRFTVNFLEISSLYIDKRKTILNKRPSR